MRSGATDGRGNYWGAGATSGTYYFGADPTNTIQTSVLNTIAIQNLGAELYFSTAKIANGIWKIPGTPHTPAAPSLFLGTGTGSAPYAFAFNSNFTSAYIADDTLKGMGGVQRWDFNGSAWSMSYAFSGLTNVGARGVTVDFSGANPIIYATTAEIAANRLVAVTDTGAASAVTTLANAGVNQIFRGVAFVPNAGPRPQIYHADQGTDGFVLSWSTLFNRNYTVQYTDDAASTNWWTLTNLTASRAVATVVDTGASQAGNRFYRVVLNP